MRYDRRPLSSGVYRATIGGIETTVSAIHDKITFLVPHGLSGFVELHVVLGAEIGVLGLTVTPAIPIADAAGVMSAIFDDDLAGIAEDIAGADDLIAQGKMGPEARTDLEAARAAILDARRAFSGLSVEDQQLVAAAIVSLRADAQVAVEANRALLDELRSRSLPDFTSLRSNLRRMVTSLALLAAPTVAGALAGSAFGPGGAIAGAVAANYARRGYVTRHWNNVQQAFADMGAEAFRPVDVNLFEFRADYAIKSGLTAPLTLDVELANLQPGDVDDPHDWIASAAKAVTDASAASRTLFPDRPLNFAQPKYEEQALPALHLNEFDLDANQANEGPFNYVEFFDISDPQISCWPVGTWNWYYPGQPAFVCENTEHTVTTFSFRIRYTHELPDSAPFEIESGLLTAELDSTCTYRQFLLGTTPLAGGMSKDCFGSGLVVRRDYCLWEHEGGACMGLNTDVWSSGCQETETVDCSMGNGDWSGDLGMFQGWMMVNGPTDAKYRERGPSGYGRCNSNGSAELNGDTRHMNGTPVTCGDVHALSPLEPETNVVLQEGLCGGC